MSALSIPMSSSCFLGGPYCADKKSTLYTIESKTEFGFKGVLFTPINAIINIALTILSAIPAIFNQTARDFFKRRAVAALIDITIIPFHILSIFSEKAAGWYGEKCVQPVAELMPHQTINEPEMNGYDHLHVQS